MNELGIKRARYIHYIIAHSSQQRNFILRVFNAIVTQPVDWEYMRIALRNPKFKVKDTPPWLQNLVNTDNSDALPTERIPPLRIGNFSVAIELVVELNNPADSLSECANLFHPFRNKCMGFMASM